MTDAETIEARLRAKHPASGNYAMKANGSLINPDGPEAADLIASLRTERDAAIAEKERTERNRDMWKGQCERQADKLRAWQEWLQRINADPDNLEYLNGSAWDDAAALAAGEAPRG